MSLNPTMKYFNYILFLMAALPFIVRTVADDTDLADFEFDADIITERATPAERRSDLELLDDTSFEETSSTPSSAPNAFAAKEQRIRAALQRATKNGKYTQKFAQLLPILRSLNKQHKIVLASLITAQSGAAPGKEISFKQVESMFGQSRSLMLPILFDIANLIRAAASSTTSSRSARTLLQDMEFLPQSESLKHNYIPINSNETKAILTTEPIVHISSIQDDRLEIDDDSIDTARNVIHAKYTPGPEPLPHPMPLNDDRHQPSRHSAAVSEVLRSRRLDQRSYHERKLNMTNFNGSTDQFAMESEGVPIQITLPRSPMPPALNDQGLTLEQYENLALRDLNETDIPSEYLVRNETTGELLPLPEMLISRYRNKHNPYRKLLNGANSVETLRTCERFGSLCLRVEDYPTIAIMGSIRRHKHAMSALLAEFIDKEDVELSDSLTEEASRREDDELTPSGMCPSVIRYARPQKARSATGEWKYIVNTGQHTQTLRLEKCTKSEESCTYLTDNFRSRCVQVFNYHRLLSWDNTRGLHIDIFKVPTCCSCHIDSYKEKFPPQSSYNGLQEDHRFSASNIHSFQQPAQRETINHHSPSYSTILSEEEDSGEDEDSIAYQYSNGFKRNTAKTHKYRDSVSTGSVSKPRYEKNRKPVVYQTSPTLDHYLTPPTSDADFDFVSPYKRGGPSSGFADTTGSGQQGPVDIGVANRKRRRPVRTNNRDQTIPGSDFLPDHSVIQSHDHPNTERTHAPTNGRRKATTPSLMTTAGLSPFVPSISLLPSPFAPVSPPASSSITYDVKRPSTQARPPSISTASTSPIDLGKRVNYNYHPIIDFFGDSLKSEKEINDRVGHSDSRTWRPVYAQAQQRRRQ